MATAATTQKFSHFGIAIDQKDGIGSVSNLSEVDYLGFVAFIRPRTFLELCPPVHDHNAFFRDALTEGRAFASSFLVIALEGPCPRVLSHEGRHRMRAVLEFCGDEPVPVAIFPSGGTRAHDLLPEEVIKIASGMFQERWLAGHRQFVPGPLFDRLILLNQEMTIAEVREDLAAQHSRAPR